MSFSKIAYLIGFFILGLGLGVLWSPLAGSSRTPPHVRDVFTTKSEHEKYIEKMRKIFGEEAGVFLRQFEDMNIHINTYPIDAWASRNGRFVVRVFGNEETIASDLYYPDKVGAVKDIVREYSFSSGGRTFTCSFARGINDPKITEVHFSLNDGMDYDLVYIDLDGDGHWDRFTDYTQESPKTYVREGLRWITKENPISEPAESKQ